MALTKSLRVLTNVANPVTPNIILQKRNADVNNTKLLFQNHIVWALDDSEYETIKKDCRKVVDAYACLGVLQINVGDNRLQYLIVVVGCQSIGKIDDAEMFKITDTHFIALQAEHSEEKVMEIRKFLNGGTFYFANYPSAQVTRTFDITSCAQRTKKSAFCDNRFFWNRNLHVFFAQFGINASDWLVKAVCGCIQIRTVYIGARQARAVLISRLSCDRAGTRFNVRGINDEGHVANFVETEQIIHIDRNCYSSYLLVRGSVPLFWEQTGVQVGAHKIKLSRGFQLSKITFQKHMKQMQDAYGFFAIVNLLSTTTTASQENESFLSVEFQRHHAESAFRDYPFIVFDYHAEARNPANLQTLKARVFDYARLRTFYTEFGSEIKSSQSGVARVNCLDCLDRTNCTQTLIGLAVMDDQISTLLTLAGIDLEKKDAIVDRFARVFKEMWIENGNEISKIYAGTGAIQGTSKLIDGARSAARTIQNNLLDNAKQEAIDLFLYGLSMNSKLADNARVLLPQNLLKVPANILKEMCNKYALYTSTRALNVAVGTYNVNGGKQFKSIVFKNISLQDWLNPRADDAPNDIYALGFEEIVDLSASNIMSANTENARNWCEELEKELAQVGNYALLSYQQLVGVCLFVFVKADLVPYVRDVAIDTVKTGLGGATGNKGAVAIRFVVNATSMCFVCAHFAAGQSQVTERNADFAEICKRLSFPINKSLFSHEYVFFCGDFNYRIDIERNALKEMVRNEQFDEILEEDQLTKQKNLGNVFQNFHEGAINFAPTYKYDLFSDDYDTSEKARLPAWTDRVLWRRIDQFRDSDSSDHTNVGKCLFYGRTELKQSDHRPVIAILQIDTYVTDKARLMDTYYQILENVGPPDGTILLKKPDGFVVQEHFVQMLLEVAQLFGDVAVVRFNEPEFIILTFRDPISCLVALKKKYLDVDGHHLAVSLRTPNWVALAEQEIHEYDTNTVSLSAVTLKTTPKSAPIRPPLPCMRAVTSNSPADIQTSDKRGLSDVDVTAPPAFPPPQLAMRGRSSDYSVDDDEESLPPPTTAPPIVNNPTRAPPPPPVPSRPSIPARVAPLPPSVASPTHAPPIPARNPK